MSKFKKGDRVRVLPQGTLTEHIGLVGTILEDSANAFVEFDEPVAEGHSACFMGKEGYCFAYHEIQLELVEEDLPYNFDDLTRAIKSVKMHDKDEFMLLNMIDMIKES